jgi:hypothetical protein
MTITDKCLLVEEGCCVHPQHIREDCGFMDSSREAEGEETRL